jgi:hypothetical protein
VRRFATLVWSAIYAASSAAAAPATNSSITLPIEFDLSGFLRDAERELPQRLESDWEAIGKTLKMPVAYRFELQRSQLELDGKGDRVLVSTQIRYRVDVAVPGPTSRLGIVWRRVNGCQPKEPVTVYLDTRIEFTRDWQLRARSKPAFRMPEPCRLSAARELVNIDISEKVRLAFLDGLNKAAVDFDRRLASQALLRELAEKAWAGLSEPIPLGERAWLRLNPARVLVIKPVATGRSVRTGVVLTGTPEFLPTLDARPSGPVPAFDWAPEQPQAFQLDWSTALSWSELTVQMREILVGQQIKVAGRRTVRIEDIDLRPAGDRVLVVADVSGGVKGRLQLTGRPRLDASTQRLEFAGLEFTLATHNFLIRMADWFRHESTRRKLETMSRLDVGKSLAATRATLEKALRAKFGPELELTGNLTAGEPFALAFDDEKIRLDARLTGSLTLRWNAAR